MAEVQSFGADLNDVIAEGVVVVDFYADWCSPCKLMMPTFKSVAAEYDNVIFGKVDADAQPEIVSQHGIKAIPTIFIFKDGEVAERMTGIHTHKELKESIDKHL